MKKPVTQPVTDSATANSAMQRIKNLRRAQEEYADLITLAIRRADAAFIKRHRQSPEEIVAEGKRLLKDIGKWAPKDFKKNPDDWSGQTLKLSNGDISLHTSPGKVTIIKSIAKSFEAVLELMKRKTSFKKYLRQPDLSIDKEAITAAFTDNKLSNDDLSKVGLKVSKPVSCIVDIKKD